MAIDRKKIIDSLSKLQVQSDDDGLIPGFNVLVNQMPASFWNNFSELITKSVSADMLEAAQYLLYNAANSCGYNTGYGIITSEEWKAVVEPMIENAPEDVAAWCLRRVHRLGLGQGRNRGIGSRKENGRQSIRLLRVRHRGTRCLQGAVRLHDSRRLRRVHGSGVRQALPGWQRNLPMRAGQRHRMRGRLW